MKTTDELTSVLKNAKPDDIEKYIAEHKEKLVSDEKPFAEFMRGKIRTAGLKQQEVFLAADIPEGYGYKLISEEKHTRNRDVIIRLCLAAGFTLDDLQTALKLSGHAPLYPRLERDAVLMIAANNGLRDSRDVNDLLEKHGMQPFKAIGAQE